MTNPTAADLIAHIIHHAQAIQEFAEQLHHVMGDTEMLAQMTGPEYDTLVELEHTLQAARDELPW